MSAKKLSKKTLTANLIALAAADAAHDDEHRARFDAIIDRLQVWIGEVSDPLEHLPHYIGDSFADALHIAKHRLRMSQQEFESAVVNLNTPVSRVLNVCPSGKDVREIPEFMLMTSEELRLSYRLLTPYEATKFIAEKGAIWGYTASEIALAKKAHRPLEQARVARRYDEDQARQAAETARLAARPSTGYIVTTHRWQGSHTPA